MDYLSRESAPFDESLWAQIDNAVIASARKNLIGRRFLNIYGPLGPGASDVQINKAGREEVSEDGFVKTAGRAVAELPQLYTDFTLLWRDLEYAGRNGFPLDISSVSAAAQILSNKEDRLIFFGNQFIGAEGLTTAAGTQKIKISDWGAGENAMTDIVKGVNMMLQKGILGGYVLCVSPAVFVELQRIQPGTGIMEIDRISRQLAGLYNVPILKNRQAVLLCPEPQYMDLALGQDMSVSYLELVDLNHHMRILETVLPRIKRPDAIVVYE